MKYNIIDGDITNATETVICHQVNCQGKMASGVAKALRDKYSVIYEEYMRLINTGDNLLGKVQFVKLPGNTRYIANMFAQDKYGYDGKQYTSLDAFQVCLDKINLTCTGLTVAFPWKIGCVRGGADWDTVLKMIETTLKDVKSITFYRLDRG